MRGQPLCPAYGLWICSWRGVNVVSPGVYVVALAVQEAGALLRRDGRVHDRVDGRHHRAAAAAPV